MKWQAARSPWFPLEAKGLGYVFFGSGIDDALAIKVLLPLNRKATKYFSD